MIHLKFRKAILSDLEAILDLLLEDELAQTRESINKENLQRYREAFEKIDRCDNQFLMVIENSEDLIGTCHLTLMPSLTFQGTTRLQIEAVRVLAKYRGQRIGEWMIEQAIEWGRQHGAKIIQLTTNKTRDKAINFYTKLGFECTHEGMKLYL